MIEFVAHNLAPIMFGSLVIFLLLGYPVAFSLAANGLLFFIIGVELAPLSPDINLFWPLLGALPDRFFGGVMANETLLAIPFFTFMGLILERSGMAEDLLDTIGQLFGPLRGGLAYAVIFVGALLGGYHRRRRRLGHRHGPDLAADHAALRLRPPAGQRRHRRLRHAGPDHPAVAGPDRSRRPARPLGRRHVFRRTGAGAGADLALCRLRLHPDHAAPQRRPGAAARGPHAGPWRHLAGHRGRSRGHHRLRDDGLSRGQGRAGRRHLGRHGRGSGCLRRGGRQQGAQAAADVLSDAAGDHRPDPAAGSDLPGARHDLPRRRHADGRRCHGRGRRAGARLRQAQAEPRLDDPGDGIDDQAVGLRPVHPDRRARLLADLLRRQRPRLGRGTADLACPAARSAS